MKTSLDCTSREILNLRIPKLIEKYHVPGVTAAGIHDGSIAWLQQYGVGSRESNLPLTEHTIFEACSMTKPFFTYAMLKLVEQGIVDLDIPLVTYLGRPYVEGEPLHEKITARMVLTHTGGFPNWRPGGRESGEALRVHFEPGTDYLYSGEGFWFLQKVVEHLTGLPLQKWIRTQLLNPLGMDDSSLVWEPAFEETAAVGHDEKGNPYQKRSRFPQANAAFSLYTTPRDYAQFLLEILHPHLAPVYSLGESCHKEMLSRQRETSNPHQFPGAKHTFRGLGWEIVETEIRVWHGHTGNNQGFRCVGLLDIQKRDGMVLMTNGDNGTALWKDIIAE